MEYRNGEGIVVLFLQVQNINHLFYCEQRPDAVIYLRFYNYFDLLAIPKCLISQYQKIFAKCINMEAFIKLLKKEIFKNFANSSDQFCLKNNNQPF